MEHAIDYEIVPIPSTKAFGTETQVIRIINQYIDRLKLRNRLRRGSETKSRIGAVGFLKPPHKSPLPLYSFTTRSPINPFLITMRAYVFDDIPCVSSESLFRHCC